MYQAHFGLQGQPFQNTPDTQVFFPGGQRGAVLEALLYAVRRGDAIVKVVGEVGSGKTMLCRMLETRLPAGTEIVYLANPSLSPSHVLHAIALELKLPLKADANKLAVLHCLQEHLLRLHAAGRRAVLLVEEAQRMPPDTLEEIRLLSNLETRDSKLLQIVLFGQPELDVTLAQPSMRQFTDRIAHSFYLKPFSREDVRDYIHHRLGTASALRAMPLFTPRALRAIHRASRGFVRRINFLADKALLAAFAESAQQVLVRHVRRAARDNVLWGRLQRPWFPVGLGAACVVGFALALGTTGSVPRLANSADVATPSVAGVSRQEPASALLEKAQTIAPRTAAPENIVRDTSSVMASNVVIEERLRATEAWLSGVDRNVYTIQIMTTRIERAGARESLAKLLSETTLQPLIDRLFIHVGAGRGAGTWVLTFGEFATLSEARDAARTLPDELARFRPLARTLRSLQSEVGG